MKLTLHRYAIDEGWAHSGLAYQPAQNDTPLSTVEECLLSALASARLIEPIVEIDGFGCGFERCGRTDAGVSSSAQVINLWVRSDLADPMGFGTSEVVGGNGENSYNFRAENESFAGIVDSDASASESDGETITSNGKGRQQKRRPSKVELPYTTILNRMLPPSIRVLAWSPVTATFSSRYSCIWRHYKYFFSTSPATPFLESSFDMGSAYLDLIEKSSSSGMEGKEKEKGKILLEWQKNLEAMDFGGLQLDVSLMRDAAARVIGEHDYRNLCKVDPPKQLPHHLRTVTSATIDKVEGEGSDLYVLNLRGGAFLYNQVRHIVSLLFLVGAKLEQPELIDRLLWTSDTPHKTDEEVERKNREGWELMDKKPGYEMADDLALILWQCGYNSDEFNWRIDNSEFTTSTSISTAADSLPLALDLNAFMNGTLSPSPAPTTTGPALTSPVVNPHDSLPVALTHSSQRLRYSPISVSTFRRHFLEMNQLWTEQRLKSVILKHHLASYAVHAPPPFPSDSEILLPPSEVEYLTSPEANAMYTPLGGGNFAKSNRYIQMLDRRRGELPEIANQKWAEGRGAKKMLKRAGNQSKSDELRAINLRKKMEARKKAGLVDLLLR